MLPTPSTAVSSSSSSSSTILSSLQPWKTAEEFKTEKEFCDYIQALPLETQIKMAEAKVPQANRLVAAFFHQEKDYKKSGQYWEEAARLNDPIALMHEAQIYYKGVKDLEAGLEYLNRVKIENIKDPEFAEFIKAKLKGLRIELGLAYHTRAVSLEEKDHSEKAIQDWAKSIELANNPAAAYNIGYIYLNDDKLKDAQFWLKLCLHLSHHSPDSKSLRAAAHDALALTITKGLKEKSTFNDILSVATHLKKAVAYAGDTEKYKQNLKKIMDSIVDEGTKARIDMDSEVLLTTTGIYLSSEELLSKPDISEKDLNALVSYPDPRLDSANTNISGLTKFLNALSIRSNNNASSSSASAGQAKATESAIKFEKK